jgi:glucokinase
MKRIFAADIGGTNSRFACFHVNARGGLELAASQWLETGEYSSFGDLITGLLSGDFPLRPADADVAVLAVAGPVEQGIKSSPPFISWDIDLSEEDGFEQAVLINDFVAQAYACRSPIGEQAEMIKSGKPAKDAAAAVIGAGTALGKAVTVPDGKGGFIAVPSEGGHASFPFGPGPEDDFRRFLLKELGDSYITWNKVVSGRGLSYIHHFLTGEKLDPQSVVLKITPDSETLAWAARFYGRACRDYALETLSLGGVYIAGGVAARTPEIVTHRVFEEEFNISDTLSALLGKIPVFLIKEQNAGLWGAAFLGRQMIDGKY